MAYIVAFIFIFIVLIAGLIVTISAANSTNKEYKSKKSFPNLLRAYVISIPVIIGIAVFVIAAFA